MELRGFEPPLFPGEISCEMHFVDSSVVTRVVPCPWVMRRCVTRRNSAGPWSTNGYTAVAAHPWFTSKRSGPATTQHNGTGSSNDLPPGDGLAPMPWPRADQVLPRSPLPPPCSRSEKTVTCQPPAAEAFPQYLNDLAYITRPVRYWFLLRYSDDHGAAGEGS